MSDFFLFYSFLSAYHALSERDSLLVLPVCGHLGLKLSTAWFFTRREKTSQIRVWRRLIPSPIPDELDIEGERCMAYLGR
jgi:hypothetical protein